MKFNRLQTDLYDAIINKGFIFSKGNWKKGNSSKSAYEIAELIINQVDEFEYKSDLMKEIEKLEVVWDDIHATYNSMQSASAKIIYDKYLELCDDKKFTSTPKENGVIFRTNVDDLIWGEPRLATRCGTGDEYFALPISDNNEYEEISESVMGFRDNFATRRIMTKQGLIPRVVVFTEIINNLLRKFRLDNEEFLTLEDLDCPFLSPTLLKSYLKLEKKRNKDKITVGYNLIAEPIAYTLSNYYRDSNDARLGSSPYVGEIAPLSNSTSIPSFKYIDLTSFDEAEGDCPAWDSFSNTFRVESAKEVFNAWVYSVFNVKNTSPQLLWLSSQGGTGKSSFTNALSDLLGGAVGTISDKDLESDFGLESVLNRRLVINADNKKPSIVHTETVHNLTTGDKVTINRKNKSKFSANVYVKLLICSNAKPNLNIDENNQTRRVIYIEQITPSDEELIESGRLEILEDGTRISHDNPEKFKKDLIEQFPAFMKKAKISYEKLCPTNSVIAIPPCLYETLEELNSTENYELIEFFENELDLVNCADLLEDEKYLLSGDLKEMITEYSEEFKVRTRNGWYRVESLLKNKWGILFNKVYKHPLTNKTYRGICGNKLANSPIMGFVKKRK